MKKLIFAGAVLVLVAGNLSAQTEKELKAEIKHVTVFPDRAQVDHEGNISMTPGKTILKLSGLSPYIDPQSIQVKGYGDFIIMSVNQQNNFLENLEDDPGIKDIRSQIESLQLKVEDEKTAIEVLKEKSSFLTTNKGLLLKETSVTPEQYRLIMEIYSSNMEQVMNNILKKERLVKEYEKQIQALQQQVSARMARQQLPSGEISVTVTSEKQVTGKLALSYVVSNCGWYPSYDIRVEDIKNPVTILYKANVYQNTGNSWKEVRLSFSNATPWVSGDVPLQYPWFVDFYNPVPSPGIMVRAASSSRKAMNEPVMEIREEAKPGEIAYAEASAPEVQKQVGTTTITFDITIPYTIPADGKLQTVEIQKLKSPADYRYVTLPKKSLLAYLTANITDWAQLSLQSGEATLYFENSFVGKSFLNVNQLNDTLTMSLGTDNSILVKREKRKDFTSRKTIGSNKTETNSFLITVRNNKQTEVSITVKDQIPVSTNSSITVEPLELTGGKLVSQSGYVSWDLNLKPGETKQLVLTYSVKYPKDRVIILE